MKQPTRNKKTALNLEEIQSFVVLQGSIGMFMSVVGLLHVHLNIVVQYLIQQFQNATINSVSESAGHGFVSHCKNICSPPLASYKQGASDF